MNEEAAAPHADPERAFDGQYQLGSEIGAGALGVVYRGVDEKLDKAVAIKVWHARFEEGTPQRELYDAEARALTALDHPNIVPITDYGIAGKAPYLVMELVEGESLEKRMSAGPLTLEQAQSFMTSMLRALGYMHMRGVLHRNLKPDNVFLQKGPEGETLKLLDLGLESVAANDNAARGGGATPRQSSSYDAPEREQGVEPDGRADVYAAGVLLLHMLIGREPGRELLRAAGGDDAAAAYSLTSLLPALAPEVRDFIAKAIASERSLRFGNADQMLRALLELPPWPAGQKAEGPPPLAARSGRAAHAEPEPAVAEAAEGGAAPEPAAGTEQFELKPFGLIARLRAHKQALLIGAGMVALGGAGAALAAVFAGGAEPETPAVGASAKKPANVKAAAARPEPAGQHEDLEPAEEVGEAPLLRAAGAAAPSAAATAGRPAAPSAAVPALQPGPPGQPVQPGPPGQPGLSGPPGQPDPWAAAVAASEAAKKSRAELNENPWQTAPREPTQTDAPVAAVTSLPERNTPRSDTAPAKPAGSPGVTSDESSAAASRGPGAQPAAAAADKTAGARGDATAAPRSEATLPAAAAVPRGDARPADYATKLPSQPNPRVSDRAAVPGLQPSAAEQTGVAPVAPADPGDAREPGGQAAKEAWQKRWRNARELGSVRHIELDQTEIRQMLALALKSNPRTAAADPWNIEIPTALQALRDAIARGELGTPTNIKTLRRYNATNLDDVYGHLLLAGFYANRGYALDALDQYDLAYRIDSSSRGAPEMLAHALEMVAQGIAAADAERFIERVYGREAQARIAEQLRARGTSPAAAARLRQLQARLAQKRR